MVFRHSVWSRSVSLVGVLSSLLSFGFVVGSLFSLSRGLLWIGLGLGSVELVCFIYLFVAGD